MDNKTVVRFWGKVDVCEQDGCWEYKGYTGGQGYGKFWLTHRKVISAHRFAWTIICGHIPKDMCVCHTCNNESCCNPKHLYLGDRKKNSGDAARDGLYAVGERNGLAKLTERDILEIRAMDSENNGRGTRAMLSRHYGVSDTLISNICDRKIWKHI